MSQLFLEKTEYGRDQWMEYDASRKTIMIREHQDVQPIIDQNKRDQTDGTNGWIQGKNFKKLARIPMVLIPELNKMYYRLLQEDRYGKKDIMSRVNRPVLRRILNDSIWKNLRTDK